VDGEALSDNSIGVVLRFFTKQVQAAQAATAHHGSLPASSYGARSHLGDDLEQRLRRGRRLGANVRAEARDAHLEAAPVRDLQRVGLRLSEITPNVCPSSTREPSA
jgi:hypothetical protein